MRDALAFLGGLDPQDAEWFFAMARERELGRGDVLLSEGVEPSDLFIVLEGVFEARLEALGKALVTLGPGEILGEVSLLDDRPASATVRALEGGLVLAIPRVLLEQRLAEDPAFGARVYRALGRIVARRLRAQSVHGAREEPASAELARTGEWKDLAGAIDDFKKLMQRVEAETRSKRAPSAELLALTRAGIDRFCQLLTAAFRPGAISDDARWSEASAVVRREMHPYVLLTRVIERIYSKPRGYAGDFQTIEWMYRNEPGGQGTIGPLLDGAFLDRPAARAVRNRRGLLAEEITAAVGNGGTVTSLACGPAEEVFDVFARLEDRGRLKATLIDIDFQALALVTDRCEREGLRKHVTCKQGNLVYLATGRAQLELVPQDLIYSIGLIDYFDDRFVVALLDWIHGRLRPGGKVVLGNFHPDNPDRALMEHVLDWKLIHRSEADMNGLFAASRFGKPCSEIRFEPERVNLFATAIRG
jgi:CRP-like cAMP-binding protein/SAM-dependent methyltransferase